MKCIYFSPKIAGFSLLEVLVALLILSLGLLGIAALQLSALKTTDEAYLNSVAVMQAASMLQRLQANPADANRELAIWNEQNKELLPDAKGEFVCNGTKHCTVTLYWRDTQTRFLSLKL